MSPLKDKTVTLDFKSPALFNNNKKEPTQNKVKRFTKEELNKGIPSKYK